MAMIGDWKLIRVGFAAARTAGRTVDDMPVELYNLKDDPTETTNLADRYPERVREILELMSRERVRSDIFRIPLLDD